jgi:hypothetical protein
MKKTLKRIRRRICRSICYADSCPVDNQKNYLYSTLKAFGTFGVSVFGVAVLAWILFFFS